MNIIKKIIIGTFFSLITTNLAFSTDVDVSLGEIKRHTCQSEYYSVNLMYLCDHTCEKYSGIGFFGVHAPNGQEFITETWGQNTYIPLKAYRSKNLAQLRFAKSELPLKLEARYYTARQPISILRAQKQLASVLREEHFPTCTNAKLAENIILDDNIKLLYEMTKLEQFKVWREDLGSIEFDVTEADIFDSDGNQEINTLIIHASAPIEHSKTFLEFCY